MYFNILENS